jgi:hypothetical protein
MKMGTRQFGIQLNIRLTTRPSPVRHSHHCPMPPLPAQSSDRGSVSRSNARHPGVFEHFQMFCMPWIAADHRPALPSNPDPRPFGRIPPNPTKSEYKNYIYIAPTPGLGLWPLDNLFSNRNSLSINHSCTQSHPIAGLFESFTVTPNKIHCRFLASPLLYPEFREIY